MQTDALPADTAVVVTTGITELLILNGIKQKSLQGWHQ
jgi:hypothetical protein